MKPRHVKLLVAALVATLTVTVVALSASTGEPASAFVPAGHGAAPLVSDAEDQGITALRLLSGPRALTMDPEHDPGRSLLVIIAPERPYQQDEVEAVQSFLNQGGKVLVADNFGQANTLTSPLGVTFERVRLVQPDGEERSTASVDGRGLEIQLDDPTAIRIDDEVDHQVIATSPSGSFLDRNGDGIISAGDPVGSFLVSVAVDIGARGGKLVAVADPTPFLASTGDLADNPGLREALLDALLPDGGRVIIDESRQLTTDPALLGVAGMIRALTAHPGRAVVLGSVALVGLVGVGLATASTWSHHRFLPDRFIRRADLPQAQEKADSVRAAKKGRRQPTAVEGRPESATGWTMRGRVALYGGLALAVAGTTVGNAQATTAAALMLLMCVLSLWTRAPHVRARRHIPVTRAPEDSTVRVAVELTGQGRGRRTIEVRDALPQEFQLQKGQNWFQADVSSGTPLVARYEVSPSVRGPYPVGPMQVRRSDPFRLRSVHVEAQAAEDLLVSPRHEPLSRIPFKSKVAAPTLGPHLVNRAGDGSEFHSLRDYADGDSIRAINWKASARASNFIVNQRVHESMSTITIFIDARAISAAGSVRTSPLNEACRAALSVATGALQVRDRVKVYAYGDGVTDLAPGKGADQTYQLTKALAELEGKGTTTFKEAVDATIGLRPRMPFILLSGFEGDDSVIAGLRTLHQRSIVPTVFAMPLCTDPSLDDDDPTPEPDAKRLHAEQEETIAAIRGLSVHAIPVVPKTSLSHALRIGGA